MTKRTQMRRRSIGVKQDEDVHYAKRPKHMHWVTKLEHFAKRATRNVDKISCQAKTTGMGEKTARETELEGSRLSPKRQIKTIYEMQKG